MESLVYLIYMIAGAIVLGIGFFSAVYLLVDKKEDDSTINYVANIPTVDTTVTTKVKNNDDDTENKNTFYQ